MCDAEDRGKGKRAESRKRIRMGIKRNGNKRNGKFTIRIANKEIYCLYSMRRVSFRFNGKVLTVSSVSWMSWLKSLLQQQEDGWYVLRVLCASCLASSVHYARATMILKDIYLSWIVCTRQRALFYSTTTTRKCSVCAETFVCARYSATVKWIDVRFIKMQSERENRVLVVTVQRSLKARARRVVALRAKHFRRRSHRARFNNIIFRIAEDMVDFFSSHTQHTHTHQSNGRNLLCLQ